MQARLLNKKEIAQGTMLFAFAVPEDFSFQAGEYIRIFLQSGEKRYFSVASSPNKKGSIEIATRMSESGFKTFLRDAPLGTEVEIQGPWGDLVFPNNKLIRSYQFVAGGIGITPFISMLRYMEEEKLAYNIALLYFNHDRESTAYYEELYEMAEKNENVKIEFINNSPNPSHFKSGDEDTLYYLAGPPGFVNTTLNLLQQQNIPAQQIIHESYTGY